MRIIAGSARSLPLKTISGIETRPTTDRIKETLFNMLNPKIPGCKFLDLFAGSGQIGLEAISRGAQAAVFVENNKKAALCIEENIHFTKFSEKCTLLVKDVISAIHWLEGKETFDIIFMDPPYGKKQEKEVLQNLVDSSLITKDSLLVIEMAKDTDISYIEELGYTIIKEKIYKNNQHIFLQCIK